MEESNFHKKKLQSFCRSCGLDVKGKKLVNKSKVEDIARECLGVDFTEDTECKNPDRICLPCYNKFDRLKKSKKKFDKDQQRHPELQIQFAPNTLINLQSGDLTCKNDGICDVCNATIEENDNVEPSPSKIEKLSKDPTVSPSDKQRKAKSLHNFKSKPRKS